MKISLNWLKDYIDLPKDLSAKKLAEDLTLATVEVEAVIDQTKQFENMVVGQVVELKKHPNADKLQIVMTDIGQDKPVQIVCGGINLKQGMLVAVALPGAKVRWHGEGELVELEATEIRGEKSLGMICSSNEIGLQEMFPIGGEAIIDLSYVVGIKPGQKLATALKLNDTIFEIDNKSLTNRPDLWSHYGIAAELSAIYEKKLKILDLKFIKTEKSKDLKIDIKSKELCTRYMGCLIKNVKIERSPEWLIKKLEAVGSRAINNMVDITNYVMQDIGQPLHAFDVEKISNGSRIKPNDSRMRIIIKKAVAGGKITTLDGEERELDENMLVITAEEKPIALAGIMGGANSEVDKETKSIILEAATFNPISVRKTSQKLNLHTEASMRFEKNLDYHLAQTGMLRALKLIQEIIPQAEIGPLIDVNYNKEKSIEVKVSHELLEKRMGQTLKPRQVREILERLGFGVDERDGQYIIRIPSWRATGDVSIAEDIVEEVARIYGYDNLEEKIEKVELNKPKLQPEFELENKIKNYLSLGCGMSEVLNYPWAEKRILKKLDIDTDTLEIISNPPAEENEFLQTELRFNLIKNIEGNLRFFSEFKIFELAQVFPKEKSQKVNRQLAGAVVLDKNKDAFLQTKGILEGLFKQIQVDYNFKTSAEDYKILKIEVGGEEIGNFSEIKPEHYAQFNFKKKNICLFEIDFEVLIKVKKYAKIYKPIPIYPSIERDLAFELNWDVKWANLRDVILSEAKDPIIKKIIFMSEYNLGEKKSLAFRIIYQSDRTLKDEEVKIIENKIIKLVKNKFGGELRQ